MHRAGLQGSTVFAYDARLAAGVARWWISSLHIRRIRSRTEAQRVDQGNDHANLNWNRFWNRELFFPATAASTSACPSEKALRIMNGPVRGFGESMQSPGGCWFAVAPVLYSKSVRLPIRVGLVRKNLA